MNELTITREQFDRGYLIWYGATVARHGYERVRDLDDGRIVAKGWPSQEPTCEAERLIVSMFGSVGATRATPHKVDDDRKYVQRPDEPENDGREIG